VPAQSTQKSPPQRAQALWQAPALVEPVDSLEPHASVTRIAPIRNVTTTAGELGFM
jgi:hypothetical protein